MRYPRPRVDQVRAFECAAAPSTGHSALPEVLRVFLEERTGVTVRYDTGWLEAVPESVESGAVETGFVRCVGSALKKRCRLVW